MKPPKPRTQKQIGEIVGLKPNFFNDIIHERQKCPAVHALRLAPLTGIKIEIWIDPEPNGRRLEAWRHFILQEKSPSTNTQPDKQPPPHQGGESDTVNMPRALTAENGAKAAMMGEFFVCLSFTCPDCNGEGCEECKGVGGWAQQVPIAWSTIKTIYAKAVSLFGA
jgi:hypothetical protein